VDPERVIRDAEAAGLRLISTETFLRYQYMLVFEREPTTVDERRGGDARPVSFRR
jgi:hypothetical protein